MFFWSIVCFIRLNCRRQLQSGLTFFIELHGCSWSTLLTFFAKSRLLTSDDDDDLEIADATSQEGQHSDSDAKKGAEKKRQRSRSRSLTPPPQLSLQQIMRVRNVVK